MSYQALARKWRPKNFDEVLGQEHVVAALSNALDSQRVHHAFLFAGTRGVGKTTLARIFARALNCEQGVSANPCGVCSACLGVGDGNFIDLIEVDAASRTRVDDTRELLDNVQYAPTLGRYKIYLIDEVHMLSTHSFNALLKTLEEPPAHVKFLLATTDPQKLPATILSRCIQFNLKAMDVAQLDTQLTKILEAEDIPFDPDALLVLSRSAKGSVRDALSLLDQAIAFGGGEVKSAQVRAMLGMIDSHFTGQLIKQVVAGESATLLQTVAEMSELSVDYHSALDEMLSMLHNISLYQVDSQALQWKGVDADEVENLAAIADAELLQLLFQIALVGKRDLPMAPDPRTGFEMVLLRMVAFQPAEMGGGQPSTSGMSSRTTADPQPKPSRVTRNINTAGQTEVKNQIVRTEAPPQSLDTPRLELTDNKIEADSDSASLYSIPKPENDGSKSAGIEHLDSPGGMPDSPDEIIASDGRDLTSIAHQHGWSNFIENVGCTGIQKELMMNMVPQSSVGNRLQILLDDASKHLFNDSRRQKMEQLCSNYIGSKVALEVTVDQVNASQGETPSQSKQRQKKERQDAAETSFLNDPNVQELMDLFEAEVVSGSIQPPAV